VAAAKILFEEKALVVGTKQSRQAGKAAKPAHFVLCLLLVLILPSGFFYQLIYLEQSTFSLRYLWVVCCITIAQSGIMSSTQPVLGPNLDYI